jgi:hypothetical protein
LKPSKNAERSLLLSSGKYLISALALFLRATRRLKLVFLQPTGFAALEVKKGDYSLVEARPLGNAKNA